MCPVLAAEMTLQQVSSFPCAVGASDDLLTLERPRDSRRLSFGTFIAELCLRADRRLRTFVCSRIVEAILEAIPFLCP